MAAKSGIEKSEAQRALEAFVEITSNSLKANERLALVGFGSFSVTERIARTGRNPQTGQEILIPSKKVVKFKPGSDLLESIQ